jgi:hypothetical protein
MLSFQSRFRTRLTNADPAAFTVATHFDAVNKTEASKMLDELDSQAVMSNGGQNANDYDLLGVSHDFSTSDISYLSSFDDSPRR